jgi:hypothetical protein
MVWLLFHTALPTSQCITPCYRSCTSEMGGGWCRGAGGLALPLLPKHRQAEWPTLARIQGSEAWEGLVAGEGAGSGAWPRPPRAQRRYNSKHSFGPASIHLAPCKMQANRYDGSRPTVREQDHLKTPPSLLHVKYMYLRGLCENAPRSRAESHLGWAAAVVRPFGCFEFPQRRDRPTPRCDNPWMASRWSQTQTMVVE